jgi:hypothetical protein
MMLEMTDEQLVGPRTITACVEVGDGSWEAILSCGHEVVFVVQPPMTLPGCAQCLDILLERRKHASPDR